MDDDAMAGNNASMSDGHIIRIGPVSLSITVVFVGLVAWAITLYSMSGMDNGPGTYLHDFETYILGWVIMLTAMMLPSEVNYLRVYLSLLKRHLVQPTRLLFSANVGAFLMGYILAWVLYGCGAFLLDMGLRSSAAFAFLAWDQAGPTSAGAVLVVAGVYQLSSIKDACLTHCRSPLAYFLERWRGGIWGAHSMGFRHGAICVACCWALMAVMFAVGAMNLIWMAILTIMMFAEKVFPNGKRLALPIATVLFVMGFWLALFPQSAPFVSVPGSLDHSHH